MKKQEEVERLRLMLGVIVAELVDQPEATSVTSALSEDGQIATLTVRTANDEVGKIIGAQGRHAKAIRSLVEAAASKYRLRVMVEIVDFKKRTRSRHDEELE